MAEAELIFRSANDQFGVVPEYRNGRWITGGIRYTTAEIGSSYLKKKQNSFSVGNTRVDPGTLRVQGSLMYDHERA